MVPKIMAVVYQVVAFLQLCAFVASSATSEEFKCFIVPPSKLAPNECTTSFTYIGENGETREYNRCVTHKEAPPFTQPEDDFDPDELWCPFLIFDIYDFNDDSINVQWGKCECVGVSPPPSTLAPTNSPTPFPTPVPTNAPTETDPPTPLANKCRLRAVQDPILLNSWHPEFNHGKEGADCEFPFEYNFFLRYDCVERVPDATDGRQFGWCFSNISKQEYGTCSCEGVQTPAPTKAPTISPTPEVIIPTTASPTSAPIIRVPTAAPTTAEPTPPPTEKPTSSPTVNPTPAPTVSPTQPLYATVESSVTMEVINIVDEESLKHRFRCFMTFVFSQMMYENRTWIEDLPLSDEYASDLIPFVNVSECVDHPDFSNGQVYGCNVLFRVHTSSIPIVDSVMPTSSPTSLNENVLVPTIAPSTFRNVSSNEPVTVIEFLTDVYANFESPLFQYTLGGSTKVREQLGYIVLPVEPSQKAPENERIRFCQNVKLLRPVANPPPSTNESVTPTVSPEPASQAPGEDDSTTLLTGILVPTLLVVSLCLYYVWRQRGFALCCGNEQTEEKGIEKVNGGNSPAGFLSKLYNQNRSSSGTSIPASSESSLQVGNAGSLEEHVTALSTQFKELQIELSKLRLLSVIGHGATGRIFKAEYSGSSVAVKELFTEHMLPGEGKKASEEMFNDEEWRKIWKEVKHLRLLRHPQIIQLYGCTLAPSNDTGTWRFLVVMELAKCSLLEFLNDSPKAREMKELRTLIGKVVLARQICAGCAYIHDNKMIHFDIKPANILLDMAGNAKICDLGIAKLTKGANNRIEETGSGLGGTPPYMAPELLRGDNEEISTKVDVYSFGIVLWQIFHKRSPHPSEWTVAKLFHEVMVNDYRPALVIKEDKEEEEDKDKKEEEGEAKVGKDKKDIGVDSELAGLIRECWHKDHKERPNFRTVIEALDEYKFKLGQKEIEGSEFDLNETVEVWSPVEREYVLGFIISKNLVPRHQVLNEIWLQEDNGAEKVKDREFVYVFEVQEQDTDLKRENVLFSDLIKYNPELSRMNVPTQFQSVSRIAMAHAGKSGRDNLTSDSDIETNQGPNLKLPIANVDSSHPETGTSGTTSTVSKNPKTFMLKDGEIDLQGFKFTEDGFEASEVAGNSLASNNVSMPKKSLLKYHLLGKGACGQVHAAIHLPTFDIVAVKEINFSERSARHQAVRELKVLWNSLRRVPATDSLESPEFGKSGFCPSIVAMYDAYLDSEKQCVCLVMEFMNGGSLQDSIDQQVVPSPVDETKQLDMVFGICNESVLARIAFDILSALKFIHDMKLIHLDIKPANILLNIHGEAKLADFGLAKQLENDMQANTFVGTMKYMSPERLKGEKYSYASDIWSLALTLMTCTLGRYPISIKSVSKSADDEIEKADGNAGEHSNKKEPEQKQDLAGSSVYWSLLEIFRKGGIPKLPKKVVLGQVPSKVDSDKVQSSEEPSVHEFSDDYIDFLDKGLKCDPKDRPSATELLSHPWIVKNSKKLETRTVSELPPAVMQANRSTVSAILKRASTISNVLYSVEKKANGQETKIFEEEKLSHLAEQLHLPVEVVQSELIDILSPNNN